ncbi:aspartate carbamoyltransferase catalytic subunit [Allosphingosinicella flava]|uniref:Aspartate carbamoyltransferase n=1 Tax=Allosphingosinicella flava TaxID=2771430 RepID=A0A7T2GMF1_9SPHN|nr:aspartate carbamoyltransferase catalytic subunit [Sphingosinicella flava]QPQ56208.1 aspartate carbamoyltransferase catalytic subunit [Sphingosinicella flava]
MTSAFPHRHLLGIAQLSAADIRLILDEAEGWLEFNRGPRRRLDRMAGLTQVNAFFENSTRTLLSFEMAGKKLGAEVVNMHVARSSVQKGESLADTAKTINAMRPDVFVMRHALDGAAAEVAALMDCPVVNAGDGRGEHPSQALLDALTIRRHFGRTEGLTVAICGDILHSRVARSNMLSLPRLGATVRAVGPAALLPDTLPAGIESYTDFEAGIAGADVVMILRIQRERMIAAVSEGLGDYHALYGLTRERLKGVPPHAVVMHPGPMNRGVEIDGDIADDPGRSLILQQVEAGVAVRMACLDLLTRRA